MTPETLRAIPSVDRLVRELTPSDLPRAALVALVRRELDTIRSTPELLSTEQIKHRVHTALADLLVARIRPVINGTGIIIHTNLGRSPLASQVVEIVSQIGAYYSNLELDLTSGERGGRAGYLEHNLAVLCGAEAATPVNNCAAALVLVLKHFTAAQRQQVIISRGELVQIGGGFRIPEILEASGAQIREVGTTNKTSVADYRNAICEKTAMILKVHRSNFYMEGFVESPPTQELARLAVEHRLCLVEDLGSGAAFDTEALAEIEHEPTPAEVLSSGVDLVCFSGDKLFGGPQAGIIAGSRDLVAAIKREPFFRALRCDKLILSALQTTVDLHLRAAGEGAPASPGLPIASMLAQSLDSLRQRASDIAAHLTGLPLVVEVGSGESKVGGGTLPRSALASVTLDLMPQTMGLEAFATKLRLGADPVIGYVWADRFKIDLRTVFPRQDRQLAGAVRAVFEANATA